MSDQLVAIAMVLCHPQEHSQVLRALGIYEEISFDPRTYMELVGPKMGLLQLLENLHLWAPNHVYILFWLGFLDWRIVWPFKC